MHHAAFRSHEGCKGTKYNQFRLAGMLYTVEEKKATHLCTEFLTTMLDCHYMCWVRSSIFQKGHPAQWQSSTVVGNSVQRWIAFFFRLAYILYRHFHLQFTLYSPKTLNSNVQQFELPLLVFDALAIQTIFHTVRWQCATNDYCGDRIEWAGNKMYRVGSHTSHFITKGMAIYMLSSRAWSICLSAPNTYKDIIVPLIWEQGCGQWCRAHTGNWTSGIWPGMLTREPFTHYPPVFAEKLVHLEKNWQSQVILECLSIIHWLIKIVEFIQNVRTIYQGSNYWEGEELLTQTLKLPHKLSH